jgi:argininosuccinate lyase
VVDFQRNQADAMSNLSRSVHFDWRLAPYEIEVNLVHLENLINLKIISKDDGATIRKALLEIAQDIGSGKFSFSDEDEDVHSAIERGLTAEVGAIGGSIRAGRSPE